MKKLPLSKAFEQNKSNNPKKYFDKLSKVNKNDR
jgi:hypothetical protein